MKIWNLHKIRNLKTSLYLKQCHIALCFILMSFSKNFNMIVPDRIYSNQLQLIKELVYHQPVTNSRLYYMSCVVRKPDFCICENKDADQLRGNREADQRLCFRYIDSTIPLLPIYEISSL